MTDFMNEYCMHTATCGELRKGDVGREVVLCGWAWHNRDHGGLIFVDLRDRAGYTQVVVDPDCVSADDFAKAEHLGREYVLKIAGTVRERGAEAVNPNMATGEIEVLAKSVEVLNTSVTPPFSIEDGIETDETTRMKWRYLDIRRPEMYQALHLRHKVAQAMRGALNERGFLEVETPILANSTPEGARDYIVPSRPNPGRFYALPQSPQQFKQMLMVGGIERYYQIARCFRDEDLRADRQPEFTQVDIEMGFVQGEDVMNLMEDVMAETLAAVGVEHAFPLQRMQYRESMDRFGNDRPDTRFGMELVDITDIVKNTGFKVFSSVAQSGGVVKAINAKGAGDWSRGDVEKLADIAAENGAKGMAWIAFTTDGKEKSPIIKFFSDEEFAALKEAMDVEPGDLLLFAADTYEVASAVLSALRLHMADALNVPREGHQLLWVVNFPMFKYDEDEKKYAAEHHPFTHVLDEDVDKIESDPLACGSYSYDLVMDGFEVGGGTIRIHNADEQRAVLRTCGLTDEEIEAGILRKLRMNGLVNSSLDVIRHMDREIEKESDVIPVALKDGYVQELKSSVAGGKRFAHLTDYVNQKLREMGEEILDGNVAVDPYKQGNRTACDYCPYHSVCGFDLKTDGYGFRRFKPMKAQEIWKEIDQEEDGEEMDSGAVEDAEDKVEPVQLDPGKTKKKTLEGIESGKKKSPGKENDGKEIL